MRQLEDILSSSWKYPCDEGELCAGALSRVLAREFEVECCYAAAVQRIGNEGELLVVHLFGRKKT